MLPFVHWLAGVSLLSSSDETQFRNCIVWLEDQKIRHYKIEDRGNLRNIPSSDWPKAYQQVRPDHHHPASHWDIRTPFDLQKIPPESCHEWIYMCFWVSLSCVQYLQDVNCPFGGPERQEALDWLLGLAVRYEYGDNGKSSVCCLLVSKYNCVSSDCWAKLIISIQTDSMAVIYAIHALLRCCHTDDDH